MLIRPAGVKDDGTAYSVDYGLVNGGAAGLAYKKATGQAPSVLLQESRFNGLFLKKPHHRSGKILAFAPGIREYLTCETKVLPEGGYAHYSTGEADSKLRPRMVMFLCWS
jgi:hypothetical protein